jgi:hypothetical protein
MSVAEILLIHVPVVVGICLILLAWSCRPVTPRRRHPKRKP